jgi:hypothetical protein
MARESAEEESALVVPVPEAEPAVERWRSRYDPSAAAGVPAHITVLYPFLPPARVDAATLGELERLFAAVAPVGYSLARLGRFEEVLYLAPEPRDPFKRLIELAARRYPQCPPYGGAVPLEEVEPHLTAAHTADEAVLRRAAADIAPHLPVLARAREARLLLRSPDGRWRTWRRFPLGGGG